jgi:pimeloyl-ACP methyl ester carboxylesterase
VGGVAHPAVEFVETNGQRLEVWTDGDPGSDRLALLLHGFPEHAFSWRHQLPLFAKLGYRVWAPNQRGYGKSSRPRSVASYCIEELVADVAGLVDAAGARHVTLVGHDWGGLVAWEFAARRGKRSAQRGEAERSRPACPLDQLVILNVPHPMRFREELRVNRAQRRRSRYALLFQLPWLPEWLLRRNGAALIDEAFRGMAIDKSRFPDEVLAVFRENVLQPGAATAMLNWYRAAGRAFGRLGARGDEVYPIIETPTLLIWGEEDSALGKETTYGTERYVKDLTVRYLPRVSHWVQQEAPEQVNQLLEAWLAERLVP